MYRPGYLVTLNVEVCTDPGLQVHVPQKFSLPSNKEHFFFFHRTVTPSPTPRLALVAAWNSYRYSIRISEYAFSCLRTVVHLSSDNEGWFRV